MFSSDDYILNRFFFTVNGFNLSSYFGKKFVWKPVAIIIVIKKKKNYFTKVKTTLICFCDFFFNIYKTLFNVFDLFNTKKKTEIFTKIHNLHIQ